MKIPERHAITMMGIDSNNTDDIVFCEGIYHLQEPFWRFFDQQIERGATFSSLLVDQAAWEDATKQDRFRDGTISPLPFMQANMLYLLCHATAMVSTSADENLLKAFCDTEVQELFVEEFMELNASGYFDTSRARSMISSEFDMTNIDDPIVTSSTIFSRGFWHKPSSRRGEPASIIIDRLERIGSGDICIQIDCDSCTLISNNKNYADIDVDLGYHHGPTDSIPAIAASIFCSGMMKASHGYARKPHKSFSDVLR